MTPVRVVHLKSVTSPRATRTVLEPDTTYPIAGVLGFGRGLLLRDPIKGSATKYEWMTQLHEGDIVYSKVKAFEGAVTVVDEGGAERFVSPEFPVFEVDPDVEGAYLRHYLASDRFNAQLRALSRGVGARRERVHPTAFSSIELPLPDLPEQRRIAAHLDSVGVGVRRVVDGIARRQQLRGALGRGIWQFGQFEERRMRDLVELDREPIEPDESEKYIAIGVRGFGRGMIEYPAVPPSGLSKLRYFSLAPDRLVLSNIKAWEGAVATTSSSENGRIASNRFLQYQAISDVEIEYLQRWLLSPAGLQALGQASPGSADRNRTLSMSAFENIVVRVPGKEHRARLVRTLSLVEDRRTDARQEQVATALMEAARNRVFNQLR